MNNNDKNRDLTYNEVKALLAGQYYNTQQNNEYQNNSSNFNMEVSEELDNNNITNNHQNKKIITETNKNNILK